MKTTVWMRSPWLQSLPTNLLTFFALALVAQMQTAAASAEGRITQIIAFGDSYSDDGVKLNLSTKAVAAGIPDAVVMPDPPRRREI